MGGWRGSDHVPHMKRWLEGMRTRSTAQARPAEEERVCANGTFLLGADLDMLHGDEFRGEEEVQELGAHKRPRLAEAAAAQASAPESLGVGTPTSAGQGPHDAPESCEAPTDCGERGCMPVSCVCRHGHMLQPFITDAPGFSCDVCQCILPQGTLTQFCRACNFDLCQDCAHRGGKAALVVTAGSGACAQPIAVAPAALLGVPSPMAPAAPLPTPLLAPPAVTLPSHLPGAVSAPSPLRQSMLPVLSLPPLTATPLPQLASIAPAAVTVPPPPQPRFAGHFTFPQVPPSPSTSSSSDAGEMRQQKRAADQPHFELPLPRRRLTHGLAQQQGAAIPHGLSRSDGTRLSPASGTCISSSRTLQSGRSCSSASASAPCTGSTGSGIGGSASGRAVDDRSPARLSPSRRRGEHVAALLVPDQLKEAGEPLRRAQSLLAEMLTPAQESHLDDTPSASATGTPLLSRSLSPTMRARGVKTGPRANPLLSCSPAPPPMPPRTHVPVPVRPRGCESATHSRTASSGSGTSGSSSPGPEAAAAAVPQAARAARVAADAALRPLNGCMPWFPPPSALATGDLANEVTPPPRKVAASSLRAPPAVGEAEAAAHSRVGADVGLGADAGDVDADAAFCALLHAALAEAGPLHGE
eukprot:TRINITY_DN23707_c0_g1_i1.p1 TRINITY_DN23707_c0_g1~~TRINITY_DN23707_c0_g1_i1.p1  ORF type:complete len:663 (+),score=113.89 TRINITY_DN23707_c0_g1_i1:69-1991(+)